MLDWIDMRRVRHAALLGLVVGSFLLLVASCSTESLDHDSAKGAALAYVDRVYGTGVRPIVSGITYSSDRTTAKVGVFLSTTGYMYRSDTPTLYVTLERSGFGSWTVIGSSRP